MMGDKIIYISVAGTQGPQGDQGAKGLDGTGILAWVNFNGTGTPAIRASLNVSSITDLALGQYQISFTSAFADTSYCATGSAGTAAGFSDTQGATRLGIRTTSYIRIAVTTGTSSAYIDVDTINLLVTR